MTRQWGQQTAPTFGTTTRISSTVLDIADRVIHVNDTTGADVAVPSAIAGIGVHRGAVAGVARDHAGLFWDEANSRWIFALNTAGNDATIGAAQNVKIGSLLAMSTWDSAIDLTVKTDSAAFPGDAGTTHRDLLFRLGGANLNADGNLVNPNRSGAEVVAEYEYNTGTPRTITGTTGAAVSPIVVTVASTAGMANGDMTFVEGVTGNTAANGFWKIKNLTGTTFELWNWVVGGADTASTGNGAYAAGGVALHQLTNEWYLAYQQPGTNTEHRPIFCSFNAAGTWLSELNLVPSAALTLTAGAASVWSTTAGALTVDGFAGINFKRNGTSYLHTTTADTITIGSAIHLVAVGGAANVDWSTSSGFFKFPNGAVDWNAANGKSFTLSGGNQALLDVDSANGIKIRSGATDGVAWYRLGANSWTIDGLSAQTLRFGQTANVNVFVQGTLTQGFGAVSLTGGAITIGDAAGSAFTAAGGPVSLFTEATARTVNMCTGNAIQTINLGTHATPVNVIKIGGTASTLGLYGVTPAVQGAVGATLTNNVTAGGTANQLDDFAGALYATDAAAIRNDIYQLGLKVQTLEAKLKLLGAVKT